MCSITGRRRVGFHHPSIFQVQSHAIGKKYCQISGLPGTYGATAAARAHRPAIEAKARRAAWRLTRR